MIMETYNSIEVTMQLVKDGKISQEIAETIFPELKENKGEKIRKALIRFVESFPYQRLETDGVSVKETLAWLKKQKHGEVAIEGQVRDHNFIDFDSSGTSFMIPVPNHNLKCGDKVLVKILKIE